ncbi:uncharacterized protein LOC119840563 [Zerene cesonia]|uniref:uncharacterized protein LOC119840563 n=1 Tax=Zerene cesonia TaxID=33412 RepID=UPI0018E532CD|nr:uncharacterized protein LOC119840563 [Zerene cesonia]
MEDITVETNRIAAFFSSVNKFAYICGLPNFLNNNNNLPPLIVRYNTIYISLINILLFSFVAIENLSFITQKNFTTKQKNDLMTFAVSHFMLSFYYVSLYLNRNTVKKLAFTLTISLKKLYNDVNIEKDAIKKSKVYMVIFLSLCSGAIFSYGLEALILVVLEDGKFITVITAFPDVEDNSVVGNIWRVVFYLFWWFFIVRIIALFLVVIVSIIYLRYQYKNLQSYFYSLATIFDEDISQSEKENKYEKALKTGIQLHADTLRCTKDCQQAFYVVLSVQLLINMMTVVLIMMRFMVNIKKSLTSEHTPMNLLATGVMGTAILIGTGLFMWNLGDVTVEASKVPTAIYSSGWENCTRGSSARVRHLISFSITQGQKHVALRAIGVIELSYSSYVTLVKSSYSVFSLIY